MRLFIVFWIGVLCTPLVSFAADVAVSQDDPAHTIVRILTNRMARMSPVRAGQFRQTIAARLLVLQDRLVRTLPANYLETNRLYETIRRGIFPDSISEDRVMFDDSVGIVFSRVNPQDVALYYYPEETPTVASLASPGRVLINGSYFSRQENAKPHVGLLWYNGRQLSSFVEGDSQVTHTVCIDTAGYITFWTNTLFFDDMLQNCTLAFQAGPLITTIESGRIVDEHLAPNSYIGKAHNRTALLVFDSGSQQELWTVSAFRPMTLGEMRDAVLRESRWIGTYDRLTLFNLDGGSSVAYRHPEYSELNFGSNKRLPVLFSFSY